MATATIKGRSTAGTGDPEDLTATQANAILGFGTSAPNIVPPTNDGAALGTAALAWADIFLALGAVINFNNGDVTITHGVNVLTFAAATNGYQFQDGPLRPVANDGIALGTATVSFSDLFLASGGVVNWNNSDVTITHAANALTFAGATNGYQFQDGPIQPVANDGIALGTAMVSFADLFLASGGVVNWNNGDFTLIHSAGALSASGAFGATDIAVTGSSGAQGGRVSLVVPISGHTLSGANVTFDIFTNLFRVFEGGGSFRGANLDITKCGGGVSSVITAEQFSALTADRTGTNVTTAQNVFGASEDVISLAASTTYQFEAEYEIDTTGTASHSLGVLFAVSSALTSMDYRAITSNGTASATTSAASLTRAVSAALQVVTAAVAAATQNTVSLKGILRTNGATTLTPQFQYQVTAPGVAPTIRRNSFFRIWPVGSDTLAFAGDWS
jgi:hypothetical protein